MPNRPQPPYDLALATQGGGCSGAADLGGSIITGTDGNPLAVLARQMQIPMHVISDNTPLYLDGGREADAEDDQRVGTAMCS
eukprot:190307-Chlamydomonas_euryale.AAC.1